MVCYWGFDLLGSDNIVFLLEHCSSEFLTFGGFGLFGVFVVFLESFWSLFGVWERCN